MIRVLYASQALKLQMVPVEFRILIIVNQMIKAKHALIPYLDGITLKIIKLFTNKLSQMEIRELTASQKMALIVYFYRTLLVNFVINLNV
jgi:hypothetical protein